LIQILALRRHASASDGAARAFEVWFEKGIRSPSVEDIFLDPEQTLQSVSPVERYNIYYTVAECHEEKGRKFLRQFHVPFDIDGIDVPEDVERSPEKLEPLARVVCAAIGVEFEETAVLFTGNGLQLIIGLDKPFEDQECFDRLRPHYRAICDRINLRLSEHALKGSADPSVWSPARLLRHPATWNRKPDKPLRRSQILQENILRGSFDLTVASGLPAVDTFDQINQTVAKSLYTPDGDEIMDPEKGCQFLSWAKANPKDVTEPQWYAALSIVGLFPNGREAAHDISRGHPKYNERETELKAKQALEASGPRTCANINSLWGKCQTCVHFNKITSPIAIVGEKHIKTAGTGFWHVVSTKTGQIKKTKPAYDDLLKYFMRQHDYLSVRGTHEIFAWNGLHWEEKIKDDVLVFAQDHFDPKPDTKLRNEFWGHVKTTNTVPQDWFTGRTKGLFNFPNGVFDVAAGELRPHFKDSGFKFVLPANYAPGAEAPTWNDFISNVTCNRIDLQLVLQEFMGYILSGMDPIYQKGLLLLGTGANGKSTFVNVLRALCGKNAFSNLSLKDMGNDQRRYIMKDKIVNIAEENSRDSFRDTELAKNFITGGFISVKPLYAQPFEYQNTSKLVALCNRMPDNADHTEGFFRRFLIVPFDKHFSEAEADVNIEKKLIAELPGIFNFAIEGYRRLVSQGGFSKSQTIADQVQNYSHETNEVRQWLVDECTYNPLETVSTQNNVLYSSFTAYCEQVGIRQPPSMIQFGRQLAAAMKMMGRKYETTRPRSDAGQRLTSVRFLEIRSGKGMHLVINHAADKSTAKLEEQ
jgi:P4 family phage/plasmid primase-like protien